MLPISIGLIACRSDSGNNQSKADELFSARSLGLGYLQKDQLPEAEAQFKTIVRLAPKDPLGYANLGVTYLRAGRYDEAENNLKRARELDRNDPEVGLTLAKLYDVTNRRADARQVLESMRKGGSAAGDARVLYALAELESHETDAQMPARYEQRLEQALAVAPANVAIRARLVDASLHAGHADSAIHQLEEIRRTPPELPKEARASLERAIQLLRSGKTTEARAAVDAFLRDFELTKPYQGALDDVRWLEGPIAGRPVLTFNPRTLITMRGAGTAANHPAAVRFVDITSDAGIPDTRIAPGGVGTAQMTVPGTMAVGDFDGDGSDDLYISVNGKDGTKLYRGRAGQFLDVTDRVGLHLPSAVFAQFVDLDNDGWLDLFIIGTDHAAHLFRNTGGSGDNAGKFEDVTAKAAMGDIAGATGAAFADLDHDGDLDVFLVGGTKPVLYRNNGDGTFAEASAQLGFAGAPASAAAFGDVDGDGRTDVVSGRDDGITLMRNGGALHFADSSAAAGLRAAPAATRAPVLPAAVALGDYNNDGALDLFYGRSNTAELFRNTGRGAFASDGNVTPLRFVVVRDARFFDYDNDGWLDLIAIGTQGDNPRPDVVLLHNEGNGNFVDRSTLLPATLKGGTSLALSDVDNDGDVDVFVGGVDGGVRLLRNDGGNARMEARVELHALRTGAGKNNTFGIGSRIELRAGDLYQTRVVSDAVTHFGLGPHLKADVVRIEWTNGVPQTIYFPGSDQDVLEGEMLKGSCAMLFAWDGKQFRFVTDVMWRSALGMPLGIMGSQSAFAPAQASQEYLRIPGALVQPRNGRYVLQFTEELWEVAYTDEIRLLAVDHPDSVDVFVDERFVPPAPVNLRMYKTSRSHAPLSAVDEHGNDALPALRAMDSVYVSNLTPREYQGVVEPHDLVMDLGPDAGRVSSHLVLRGWIYPTDASINVALGQQSRIRSTMPSLEVRDARGTWVMVYPSIGFPSGKDKAVVVALGGKFPTADHHVRIRTSMQIYWDQAFVTTDAADAPSRVTQLRATSADLHKRGFSRMYRKGGRYGPYWFDYNTVSIQDPWRTIEGAFTRYGDVLSLLKQPDDMYVVMGPGDETTVEYDATSAPPLPAGWKRDFLLYTDGWIKDSDLNTAYGTSVEPLPFHAITSYPYAAGEHYPTDSAHVRYLREYQTRVVRREISALRKAAH